MDKFTCRSVVPNCCMKAYGVGGLALLSSQPPSNFAGTCRPGVSAVLLSCVKGCTHIVRASAQWLSLCALFLVWRAARTCTSLCSCRLVGAWSALCASLWLAYHRILLLGTPQSALTRISFYLCDLACPHLHPRTSRWESFQTQLLLHSVWK